MPRVSISRSAATASWFASPTGRVLLERERLFAQQLLQARPTQPWLWLSPGPQLPSRDILHGPGIRLFCHGCCLDGDVRCTLPLAFPTETIQLIVLEHPMMSWVAELLQECARILIPGGHMVIFTLNPWSPLHAHWARHRVVAIGPRRLQQGCRQAGLASLSSLGYWGPSWRISAKSQWTYSRRACWRGVTLVRAHKRVWAPTDPIAAPVPSLYPATTRGW